MFRGQSHISKFLAAVADGDTWTRTRIGVAARVILVIEARLVGPVIVAVRPATHARPDQSDDTPPLPRWA
jgi:hypothetical protein